MSHLIDLSGLSRFLSHVKTLISTKANKDLSDVTSTTFANKMVESQADKIYTAESSDGVAYTVTIPGITQLYAGLEITIKVSRLSASVTPSLNVNGLGAKGIRQPLSVNNVATAPGGLPTWLSPSSTIKLTYSGSLWKTDFVRTSASYMYGIVPIASGGTGADTAEEALTNLGAASVTYVDSQVASLLARIEALESK